MAERRMFAKTIIDSDAFIDMPLSTQALYFHLSMRADDEGFINNPRKIQRMIGAADDDLKVLITKKFIIPFESGIVVIKHWKIHNYIRGDRKKETVYIEERNMLDEKENGTYTLIDSLPEIECGEAPSETARQRAYKESDLPYSFEYKIRQAFYGKKCPICGCSMSPYIDECGISTDIHKPTIQHNIPISKGGKHELGNISVICRQCNVSLQDTETGSLNADEVIETWDKLVKAERCPTSDGQATVNGQSMDSIGKVRLGKDRIGKDRLDKKVSKKETFDDLIDNYTDNEELRSELKNHLAVRKAKKGAMTNRAIELSLNKLSELTKDVPVNEAEAEKTKIVQQSIENGWVGFFELKKQYKAKKTNDGWDYLNEEFDKVRNDLF